jgi:hypothetical protein
MLTKKRSQTGGVVLCECDYCTNDYTTVNAYYQIIIQKAHL